ncbi:MAG: hypothetical protein KME64_38430 [Scytonematopsis contorta HA4267-MV1]|nr:hypothetical protein [Scytonematopsis contorta HA4267-MV1]
MGSGELGVGSGELGFGHIRDYGVLGYFNLVPVFPHSPPLPLPPLPTPHSPLPLSPVR